MTNPIQKNQPIAVDVEAGKSYMWCACGNSQKQPWCDGSHAGTGKSPVMYTATESKTVHLCGCKNTGHAPVCDGSHQLLTGGGRDEHYSTTD